MRPSPSAEVDAVAMHQADLCVIAQTAGLRSSFFLFELFCMGFRSDGKVNANTLLRH